MTEVSNEMEDVRIGNPKQSATWSLVLVMSLVCFMLQRGVGISPQAWVDQLGLFPPEAWILSNVYRFATYALIHVETGHWFINILGIILFGAWFERQTSAKALLGVFSFGAISAGATHAAMYPESVLPLMGASGGVSALVGAAIVLGLPSQPLRAILGAFAMLALSSLAYAAVRGSQELPIGGDTAHVAHLGGLAIGILFSIGFLLVTKPA